MARTTGKKANGEGSVYQRGDGTWCASLSLDGGKRRVLYGKTRQEVARKLNAAQLAKQQGIPAPPQRLTVGKLLDEWLERDVMQRSLTRTQESYAFLIRVHLRPALGSKRVADLTVRDVEDFLRAKANEKSNLGKPYAASNLRSMRAVLSGALTYGQRLDLVFRNVARLARIPVVEQAKKRTAMTPELARAFLDKVRGHRLEALYSVAMAIGLRQAEALGLRWDDVDLERGLVHVRVQLARVDGENRLSPPKRHQQRTIPLPRPPSPRSASIGCASWRSGCGRHPLGGLGPRVLLPLRHALEPSQRQPPIQGTARTPRSAGPRLPRVAPHLRLTAARPGRRPTGRHGDLGA